MGIPTLEIKITCSKNSSVYTGLFQWRNLSGQQIVAYKSAFIIEEIWLIQCLSYNQVISVNESENVWGNLRKYEG